MNNNTIWGGRVEAGISPQIPTRLISAFATVKNIPDQVNRQHFVQFAEYPLGWWILVALFLLGDLFDITPNPQQIATPHLADLLFGVAAADQLEGDVEGFGSAVPAFDAATTVEVR